MRTWLHQWDPITKAIALLSAGWAVIWTMDLAWQIGWFATVVGAGVIGSGWSGRQWRQAAIWLLGFGGPLVLFQWLVLPGETPWLTFGSLTLTLEALRDSLALTLRTLTLFLSSLLFATTTKPRDVVVALAHHLRLPPRFAYAVAIALRFVPLLAAEAAHIRHAQRLRPRAPARGLKQRLSIAGRYVLTVAVNALRHAQEVATTMEAKRFGAVAERTYWRTLYIAPIGKVMAAAVFAAMMATMMWG
ncbi:energy-coupling factor transporter transmembrane protein EcfT [Paenibacillus sp. 481]|nr:energy-coupling factor transporter transmembrane protein EcfT [Paenibacillus sp. 481]